MQRVGLGRDGVKLRVEAVGNGRLRVVSALRPCLGGLELLVHGIVQIVVLLIRGQTFPSRCQQAVGQTGQLAQGVLIPGHAPGIGVLKSRHALPVAGAQQIVVAGGPDIPPGLLQRVHNVGKSIAHAFRFAG